MATPVVMPKAGNSVESSIIVEWKKKVGDAVAVNDVLCEIETDKATMEVPSPAAGVLLAVYFQAGDDVPVMTTIAVVGQAGEDIGGLAANGELLIVNSQSSIVNEAPTVPLQMEAASPAPRTTEHAPAGESAPVSPRARQLAERRGVDAAALAGSGPGGRVIERDVQAAIWPSRS